MKRDQPDRMWMAALRSTIPPGTVTLTAAIRLTATRFEKRFFASSVSVFQDTRTGQLVTSPPHDEMLEQAGMLKPYEALALLALQDGNLQAMIGDSGKCLPDIFWCCGMAYRAIETGMYEGQLLVVDKGVLETWWRMFAGKITHVVDGTEAPEPAPVEEAHSYRDADEALMPKMSCLMKTGRSRWAAARELASEATGGGTDESKARRLHRRYKEWAEKKTGKHRDGTPWKRGNR